MQTSQRTLIRPRTDVMAELIQAQGRRHDWLAQQAGVHPSFVTHLLAGRKTVSQGVADRIAVALGVPFSLLFDRSDDKFPRHTDPFGEAA